METRIPSLQMSTADNHFLRTGNSRRSNRSFRSLAFATILLVLFSGDSSSLSSSTAGPTKQSNSRPHHERNVNTNLNTQSDATQKGYWCDFCGVGFNKHKSYLEHIAGKKHKAVVAQGDAVWEEYKSRGIDSVFFDTAVTEMDVARGWSLDSFMEGLRARGKSSKKTSVSRLGMVGAPKASSPLKGGNNQNAGGGNQIDPTLRLGDLPPSKLGALYRYLHETSSGIQCLPDMIEALPPIYVRVKELLESIEVYHQFRALILKRSGKIGKRSKRITHIYDIGCGHGLVGMLIAAACPHIQVISIDIVPRESFVAQKKAFADAGVPLTNLRFETGDLSLLRDKSFEQDDDHHALVLCVHGCKELTHESIEVARERNWPWLAVPCCLQAEDQLGEDTALKIQSDHTRYAFLCGAIAANHHPDIITTIDTRITGRNIVMASSGNLSDEA